MSNVDLVEMYEEHYEMLSEKFASIQDAADNNYCLLLIQGYIGETREEIEYLLIKHGDNGQVVFAVINIHEDKLDAFTKALDDDPKVEVWQEFVE